MNFNDYLRETNKRIKYREEDVDRLIDVASVLNATIDLSHDPKIAKISNALEAAINKLAPGRARPSTTRQETIINQKI